MLLSMQMKCQEPKNSRSCEIHLSCWWMLRDMHLEVSGVVAGAAVPTGYHDHLYEGMSLCVFLSLYVCVLCVCTWWRHTNCYVSRFNINNSVNQQETVNRLKHNQYFLQCFIIDHNLELTTNIYYYTILYSLALHTDSLWHFAQLVAEFCSCTSAVTAAKPTAFLRATPWTF